MQVVGQGPWPCFWVEPTGWEARYLRRYRSQETPCPAVPARGYHNAQVQIEAGRAEMETRHGVTGRWEPEVELFLEDPRWPARCACGYAFTEEDHRQVHTEAYYYRPDTREQWPMRELPIGAMLDADWHRDTPRWCGPDGLALMVKLPPGGPHDWWLVDGPSSGNGPGWSRTGIPPAITVTPSINALGSYHGFLQNGQLTPGLAG